MRLLQGRGYDPAITETIYLLTGEPWTLPRSTAERIAYGNADLVSLGHVSFLECFGGLVIAIAREPQRLELCRGTHRAMMQQSKSWERATNIRQIRSQLDSLNTDISEQLQKALYYPPSPGAMSP